MDLLLHTRLVLSGGKFLLKVASIKSVDAKKSQMAKLHEFHVQVTSSH